MGLSHHDSSSFPEPFLNPKVAGGPHKREDYRRHADFLPLPPLLCKKAARVTTACSYLTVPKNQAGD